VITGGRGHEHVTGNSIGAILQPHDVDAVEMQVVDDEMPILRIGSEISIELFEYWKQGHISRERAAYMG